MTPAMQASAAPRQAAACPFDFYLVMARAWAIAEASRAASR